MAWQTMAKHTKQHALLTAHHRTATMVSPPCGPGIGYFHLDYRYIQRNSTGLWLVHNLVVAARQSVTMYYILLVIRRIFCLSLGACNVTSCLLSYAVDTCVCTAVPAVTVQDRTHCFLFLGRVNVCSTYACRI